MSLFSQIQRNRRLSVLVVIGFILFVVGVGASVGVLFWDDWGVGVLIAAVFAAIYIPITLLSATDMIMTMNGAIEIKEEEQNPFLWHTVESLAIAAKVPRPRIFIIPTDAPNAFAAGIRPEKAAVAVTRGLLERLNREEIEAVLAHEVAHIRNYDVRLASIAIALVGVVAFLSDLAVRSLMWGGGKKSSDNSKGTNLRLMIFLIIFVILGPIIATMIQLLLSRRREFLADADGARLCRNPGALASALEKIAKSDKYIESLSSSSASLYFSDPRKKSKRSTGSLFATHPPVEERIKALRAMISHG